MRLIAKANSEVPQEQDCPPPRPQAFFGLTEGKEYRAMLPINDEQEGVRFFTIRNDNMTNVRVRASRFIIP